VKRGAERVDEERNGEESDTEWYRGAETRQAAKVSG